MLEHSDSPPEDLHKTSKEMLHKVGKHRSAHSRRDTSDSLPQPGKRLTLISSGARDLLSKESTKLGSQKEKHQKSAQKSKEKPTNSAFQIAKPSQPPPSGAKGVLGRGFRKLIEKRMAEEQAKEREKE